MHQIQHFAEPLAGFGCEPMSCHFQDKQYWWKTSSFPTPDFNIPIEGVNLAIFECWCDSKDGTMFHSCRKTTLV